MSTYPFIQGHNELGFIVNSDQSHVLLHQSLSAYAKSGDFSPFTCDPDFSGPVPGSSSFSSGDDDFSYLNFELESTHTQPNLDIPDSNLGSPFLSSSSSSSSSGDEDVGASYGFGERSLGPPQFPFPQPFLFHPVEDAPTLTVAPSELGRSESPSISDATPPPTTYPPIVLAARLSHSSLFSTDPDAGSNCDDRVKDEDYTPESDSEPAFSGSSNRKRRLPSEEYCPEVAKKKPRISGPSKRPTPKSAIKLPSAKVARTRPSGKRAGRSAPPRNIQADSTTAEKIMGMLECTKETIPSWQCPACPLYQYNHRMPDFKRHMKTHLGQFRWCIGVLQSEAEKYGISPNATPNAKALAHTGESRVGCCGMHFSRADAYTRHVKNPNNSCVMERKGGRGY